MSNIITTDFQLREQRYYYLEAKKQLSEIGDGKKQKIYDYRHLLYNNHLQIEE